MNSSIFFLNDTPTTKIYTLSLHDALPISPHRDAERSRHHQPARLRHVGGGEHEIVRPRLAPPIFRKRSEIGAAPRQQDADADADRKSTRLNSSHANISYAVFCLKKKNFISDNSVGTRALLQGIAPSDDTIHTVHYSNTPTPPTVPLQHSNLVDAPSP